MAVIKNNLIEAQSFIDKLKQTCNNLLPTTGYYASDTTNTPEILKSVSTALTTRSALLNDVYNVIDTYCSTTSIKVNGMLTVSDCITLFMKTFKEMGRCRKVHYYDAGQYSPGTDLTPEKLIQQKIIVPSKNAGTWTYFKASFTFGGTYSTIAPVSNSNTDKQGYITIPNKNTVAWNNNTTKSTFTGTLDTMKVNEIIKALEGVDAQISEYAKDWSELNNAETWWSGNPDNQSDTSNKVLFVRYWCHSSCHNNCYHNCHGNRSRR